MESDPPTSVCARASTGSTTSAPARAARRSDENMATLTGVGTQRMLQLRQRTRRDSQALCGGRDLDLAGHEEIEELGHRGPVLACDARLRPERRGALRHERRESRGGPEILEHDRLANLERDRRAQAPHGVHLVLGLRATVLADRADTREPVPQPHRALRLVAVLPTRPRRSVAIDLALRDQRIVAREEVVASQLASFGGCDGAALDVRDGGSPGSR